MAIYIPQVTHLCTLMYPMQFMNMCHLYISQDLRYLGGERDCTKVVQKMKEIFTFLTQVFPLMNSFIGLLKILMQEYYFAHSAYESCLMF